MCLLWAVCGALALSCPVTKRVRVPLYHMPAPLTKPPPATRPTGLLPQKKQIPHIPPQMAHNFF